MTQAIVLFSGGLDSMLAALLVHQQNIDVLCLSFATPFFGPARAKESARQIGLPLAVEDITGPHLDMLKSPRYGFGKNMNPCIDCHTLMLKIAGDRMIATGVDFLVTGEVLGQRPMSQTKQSLFVVAKNSGYANRILRPLSAQLLSPIEAETDGRIDRSKLLAISGRGRKDQMRLAEAFGIRSYPPPAGGCLLTDPIFSVRLRDLMARGEDRQIRDYELLKYGRHFRTEDGTKIIVGRNKADNDRMRKLMEENDLVCFMADYAGPSVLVPYGNESAKAVAAALCVRYSDAPDDAQASVICRKGGKATTLLSRALEKEECQRLML
ncbi:MAG: tRNA 4-thiouridine(8) synthase ThiI [Smithellaceae bacterium]